MEKPEEVEIQVWVHRGMMMVNAYALDFDDDMHPYNQIVNKGLDPEDYGLKHPLTAEFEDKSRSQLIHEIIKLRKEIEGFWKADAMGVLPSSVYRYK